MTRDELRQTMLAGQDRLMNSAVWRFLNANQKRLMQASRAALAVDGPATNGYLDEVLALLSRQKATEGGEPCP